CRQALDRHYPLVDLLAADPQVSRTSEIRSMYSYVCRQALDRHYPLVDLLAADPQVSRTSEIRSMYSY
ncbi:hypothetical protein C5706_33390, partial [Klebsiella pneumoniae]